MASLIKNQIIKHLSKFAKNLNPDQISVEVLRGKGELHNIELNEALITEALELPAWLKIQRAVCNRVAVKVPWTSLKTLPVTLLIDEIRVDVVMSSNLRETKSGSTSGPSLSSSYSTYDTGYGFANRVAEGMSLNINSLEIYFTSEVFGGSLTLNQFRVASSTPFWKAATDLRQTRIRDPNTQQALLFKQVSWQLLRIEASSLGDSIATGYNINAPLRLITSQGRARITVKKSTVDGSVITGRMQIILDDLLWVATLPQVRSAISFYRYIMKLVQTASDVRKTQHAEKLLQQVDMSPKINVKQVGQQHHLTGNVTNSSSTQQQNSVFRQYDVVATSYHFYAGSLDLHICDDPSNDVKYPANWNFNSGALQISLSRLACDFYPYHLANRERDYWVYYNDVKCRRWMSQLLEHYYKFFMSNSDATHKHRLESEWSKLTSQCCVVRLDDFTVYCVSEATTTTTGKNKNKLEKLISADHEILKLPGNLPLIHVEFADYYYGSAEYHLPVPPSSTHIQINPIRIYIDLRTFRWISFIYLDLCKTLGLDTTSVECVPHCDVRIEALMPRLVFPAQFTDDRMSTNSKIPDSVIVQISSYTLTNCLIDQTTTNRNKLKDVLNRLENIDLFRRRFLVVSNNANERHTFNRLPDRTASIDQYLNSLTDFLQTKTSSSNKVAADLVQKFTKLNALNDLWTFELNPVWIDFTNNNNNSLPSSKSSSRPSPFLIDSPVDGWALLGNNLTIEPEVGNNANGYMIIQPKAPLKLTLDHYQYIFLVDALEQVSKFMVLLTEDARCFYETMDPKSMSVTCLAPLVELTLILPVSVVTATPSDSQLLVGDTSPVENVDMLRNRGVENEETAPSDGNFGLHETATVETSSLTATAESTGALPANQSIPEFTAFSLDSDQIPFEVNSSTPSTIYADDTISVNTDMSDDDQFVLLDNSEPSMFDEIFPRQNAGRPSNSFNGGADIGEEACEIAPSHSQVVNSISRHLQRKVSVINCKFRQAQLTMVSYDQESRIILQTPKLEVTEENNITLEELYKLLNTKTNYIPDSNDVDPNGDYQLKLAVITEGDVDPAHLDAHLRNVDLHIGSSSLAKLTDFLQNDKPTGENQLLSNDSTVPIRVKISHVNLNVSDLTNKSSDSMLINVADAWIYQGNRNWTNELLVAGEKETDLLSTNKDEPATDPTNRLRQLEIENAEMRQKLADAKLFVQKLAKNNFNVSL